LQIDIQLAQARAAAELELRRRRDFSRYAKYPVEFALEVLEIPDLTQEQRRILCSVRDRSETNVQAAHGVGKSFVSALLILWWVFAVQGLAISTAPTKSQVEQIIWGEIRKLYDRHKAKLGGSRNELSMRLDEHARAYGFTAKNYDSNSFQGKHAEKLLLIQDEACGITDTIDEGFDSCLTGAENRGLRIGNPVETNTPFQRACAKNHIRIAAWDHPNVAWAYELCADGIHRLKPEVAAKVLKPEEDRLDDPIKPQNEWPVDLPRDRIPGAISINWIEKVRAKKGEGSQFWKTRVEGMFAIDSTASIIPRSWFQSARARYDSNPAYWDAIAQRQSWRHGMDVGDGHDDHALSSWRGPVLYAVDKMATQGDSEDISRAAKWGFEALRDRPGTIGVDKIGVGAGALSELRGKLNEADKDADTAFGINFGGAATYEPDNDDDLFIPKNLKVELYWSLREAIRLGEVAIAPLGEYEDELMDDLAGTYYEETPKGETQIEDKKKTRKRLHRSPDLGDAVQYGWMQPQESGVWAVNDAGWSH
jgi:hypothetical protein